jgi:DNA helicase-2/ATP-dependent DNA helicase PcrA
VELGFVAPEVKIPTGNVYFDNNEDRYRISIRDRYPISINLPNKFSFTQLKAFETCPLQYKFAHILVVPTRGKFNFSFGKTMHSTLQKFFEQLIRKENHQQTNLFGEEAPGETSAPSVENLLKIYDETWINDWYESKSHEEEYRRLGREKLREFYKIHDGKWPKAKFLEKGFNLKVGDYTVRGVIDRVDEVPGGVEIVDYKTGSVPKDEKYLDKDQLLIYQLAASEVFGEKPALLSYYYLDANQKMSFIGTQEEIGEIKKKIIETVEEIKKSDFSPKPSLFSCRNCDFKDICEHRII